MPSTSTSTHDFEPIRYFDPETNKSYTRYTRYKHALSNEEWAYLCELFKHANKGNTLFIRSYCDKSTLYSGFYAREHLYDLLRCFSACDLMITPNLFKNGSATQIGHKIEDLLCISAFGIDVDYRRIEAYENLSPDVFFNLLLDDGVLDRLPPFSYVEMGHQMRLIYILSEPILTCQRGGKSAEKALKAIQKRICAVLNDELGDIADPQPFSSFFRVPGSRNTKTYPPVKVKVFKHSEERFTFKELFDYLPDLPDWYATWKKRKKLTVEKKSKKVYLLHNTFTLCRSRASFFESLRERPHIPRKCLLWLWVNNQLTMGECTLDDAYAFNRGFPTPLRESVIKSKIGAQIKSKKIYKVSNAYISNLLHLEEGELMTKREMERLEKIRAGQTRQQIAEAHRMEAHRLKEQGKTYKQIAEIMGLSIDGVKKYFRKK